LRALTFIASSLCTKVKLMYADDVALVAESGADLQNMLDSLTGY